MKAIEQYFRVALSFLRCERKLSVSSAEEAPVCATIQKEAIEQYFHAVQGISHF